MKTTLELPDELMRRVKVRAARCDQKLKDTMAHLLEAGLRTVDSPAALKAPRPRRLRRGGPQTLADIESAIGSGRD